MLCNEAIQHGLSYLRTLLSEKIEIYFLFSFFFLTERVALFIYLLI